MRFSNKCITGEIIKRVPKIGRFLFMIERYLSIPLCRFISPFLATKNNKKYTYAYGIKWDTKYDENIIYPVRDIQFEGYTFKGPNKPIEYLKTLYGNYMELPPKDARNHHKAVCKVY